MKNLTVAKVVNFCKKYKYCKVTFNDGDVFGFNSGAVEMARRKYRRKLNERTGIIRMEPISFQEYISTKRPFK